MPSATQTMGPHAHHQRIAIIAATTLKGEIGSNGKLPWRLPEDMKYFSLVTKTVEDPEKQNAVIMGRKTYESLPETYKPLPQRLNVVISSTMANETAAEGATKGVYVVPSFLEALTLLATAPLALRIESVFVIGGGQVYTAALASGRVDSVYLTRVVGCTTPCDVAVPQIVSPEGLVPVAVSKTRVYEQLAYDFIEYQRVSTPASCSTSRLPSYLAQLDGTTTPSCPLVSCCPTVMSRTHEEFQYLDLVAEIINHGQRQDDRTGVGTVTKFGCLMRFDLKDSFPLLTTKSVFWRGYGRHDNMRVTGESMFDLVVDYGSVLEELLWFIRGDTNAGNLAAKGVMIWEGNGSREFLDSRGLVDREVGDLGPIYGFQWRHFGAPYTTMHADYKGQGVDQLQRCINTLKTNPSDRRIILSAWNPMDLDKMALPPCHILCQFYVSEGRLSCMLFQRSADMGLGVPFNIASYSLLCRMMAQVCDLQPGEFVHAIGNAHVYLNHIEPLKVQLQRCPRPFPTLVIDPSIKEIDAFDASHFKVVGYHPHPKIPMEMAI